MANSSPAPSAGNLSSLDFQLPLSDACDMTFINPLSFSAFHLGFLLRKVRDAVCVQKPPAVKRTNSAILRQVQQHPSYEVFTQTCQAQPLVQNEKTTLSSLPAEIHLRIMQQVPTIAALQALSLSSRTLNDVRLMHKNVILPQVLMREMGQDTFEEAYWALKAYQAELNTSNSQIKINEFLSDWFDFEPGSLDLGKIHLTDIVMISRLYHGVLKLVKDFCVHTISPDLRPPEEGSPEPRISDSELTRITRAFYRFELYYNLYRDPPYGEERSKKYVSKVQKQSYNLFNAWNAWEVEEIACVRDYLCSKLSEVFANIQEAAAPSPLPTYFYPPWERRPHDLPVEAVALCEDLIPPWYDETAPSGATFLPDDPDTDQLKNKFLAQGLSFLSRLIAAESSQVQYKMFRSIMDCWNDLHGAISVALYEIPHEMRSASEALESFCHEDSELFERDDRALGPNFAWTWANGAKFQPFYNQSHAAYLRRLGYVMWDKQRLLRHPMFQRPARKPCPSSDWHFSGRSMTEYHQANCTRLCQCTGNVAPISTSDFPDQPEMVTPDAHESLMEDDHLTSENGKYPGPDNEIAIEDDIGEASGKDCIAKEQQICESRKVKKDSADLPITTSPLHFNGQAACNNPGETEEELQNHLSMSIMPFSGHPQAALKKENSSISQFENEALACIAPPVGHLIEQSDGETTQQDCVSNSEVIVSAEPAEPDTQRAIEVSPKAFIDQGTRHASLNEGSEVMVESTQSFPQLHSESCSCESVEDSRSTRTKLQGDNENTSQDWAVACTELNIPVKSSPKQKISCTEYAIDVNTVAEAPDTRKIARALSPEAKMLRIQKDAAQKVEGLTAGSKEVEEPFTIRCTNPQAKVGQLRASSPPASDRSSTVSGCPRSIKSETSSAISNELSASSIRASDIIEGPARHSIKRGRKLQHHGSKKSTSPKEFDYEAEDKDKSDTKPGDDNTRRFLCTKDPSEVAAWVEQSNSRSPPISQRSVSVPSTGGHNDKRLSKQQSKKENRKARKAATENANQQRQEMEAERVRKEEARKEHQRMKRERKKMEVVKAKGKGKGKGKKKAEKDGQEDIKGKDKKERKAGYLIG